MKEFTAGKVIPLHEGQTLRPVGTRVRLTVPHSACSLSVRGDEPKRWHGMKERLRWAHPPEVFVTR